MLKGSLFWLDTLGEEEGPRAKKQKQKKGERREYCCTYVLNVNVL